MTHRVDVVVTLFQGVIGDVSVFATDENGTAVDKALAYLREWSGEDFKTPDDFHKWMNAKRNCLAP